MTKTVAGWYKMAKQQVLKENYLSIHGKLRPFILCLIPVKKTLNGRSKWFAIRKAEAEGSGVASLNGKMVDLPVVNRAERTLRFSSIIKFDWGGRIMKNTLGREIPEKIAGIGEVKAFARAFNTPPTMNRQAPKVKSVRQGIVN